MTGGDRVGVPTLTLEVGATVETVNVTAETALVQTQSGERSFAIETKQIDSLPITTETSRRGGIYARRRWRSDRHRQHRAARRPSQDNIMMDGISAMDTGNNGQMLSLNIESIGEVKVLTQGG